MKKLALILNLQTAFVMGISLVSAYISLHFQLSIFIDFLILSLIIVFPLTITIRVAFKRREKAIASISEFKASILTVFYAVENCDLEETIKTNFSQLLKDFSEQLNGHLSNRIQSPIIVNRSAESIIRFIRTNNDQLKPSMSLKLIFHLQKTYKELEYLLAIKRQKTPLGIRMIILFAIYAFVIFYPASLLNQTGFNVALWYVFAMTAFKSLILILLYNFQMQIEDPFDTNVQDGLVVSDFNFSGWIDPAVELVFPKKKDKQPKELNNNSEEDNN